MASRQSDLDEILRALGEDGPQVDLTEQKRAMERLEQSRQEREIAQIMLQFDELDKNEKKHKSEVNALADKGKRDATQKQLKQLTLEGAGTTIHGATWGKKENTMRAENFTLTTTNENLKKRYGQESGPEGRPKAQPEGTLYNIRRDDRASMEAKNKAVEEIATYFKEKQRQKEAPGRYGDLAEMVVRCWDEFLDLLTRPTLQWQRQESPEDFLKRIWPNECASRYWYMTASEKAGALARDTLVMNNTKIPAFIAAVKQKHQELTAANRATAADNLREFLITQSVENGGRQAIALRGLQTYSHVNFREEIAELLYLWWDAAKDGSVTESTVEARKEAYTIALESSVRSHNRENDAGIDDWGRNDRIACTTGFKNKFAESFRENLYAKHPANVFVTELNIFVDEMVRGQTAKRLYLSKREADQKAISEAAEAIQNAVATPTQLALFKAFVVEVEKSFWADDIGKKFMAPPAREKAELERLLQLTLGQLQWVDFDEFTRGREDKQSHETRKIAFFAAIQEGDIKKLQECIDAKGFDVNQRNQHQQSALHLVFHLMCSRPTQETVYSDMATALLQKGASLLVPDGSGSTPLHYAAQSGTRRALDLLTTNQAVVTGWREHRNHARQTPEDVYKEALTQKLKEPFFAAVMAGNAEKVRDYLRQGMNPNVKNDGGQTPLHLAFNNAHKGRNFEDVARTLCANNASLEATDGIGSTPVHTAAYSGSRKVLEIWPRATWHWNNSKDQKGQTPEDIWKESVQPLKDRLLAAVNAGEVEQTRTCLQTGLDPNFKNESQQTPLHLAFNYLPQGQNRQEVATALLDARASLDSQDGIGSTPLHYAAYTGSNLVLTLYNARLGDKWRTQRDSQGKSPEERYTAKLGQ